jgi:hypothetical protein
MPSRIRPLDVLLVFALAACRGTDEPAAPGADDPSEPLVVAEAGRPGGGGETPGTAPTGPGTRPTRTRVVDLSGDGALITLHGRLTGDLRDCAYAWDVFRELLEPCQRYQVRTPARGSVRATLTWSPGRDWLSLHDEREPTLWSAATPPLVLASPSAGPAGASVVVGLHGAALAGVRPASQVVDYELRLEFEPDPGE